jgi:outer membrane protein TolC
MKILTAMMSAAPQGWCWLVSCSLALASPLALAQEARLIDGDYLGSLRLEVRTNHPSLAAAQARVQAAEAGVRAVRLWEDPMAGIGVMGAEREMRADDGDLMFMAEQMLPRRKLYEARKAKASAERSIFEAETRSAVLTLETIVAQAALELALVDEMLAIETNQLAWLESMAANAREKLKDPMGNASEALRIESEVAQERQKIDSTTRNRTRLTRQLNILLGRLADEAWPVLRLPDSASLTPALADEMNRLFQVNPMLQALLNTANAAQSEIEVARRERSPIFSVGVESSVYSGGDFRQATVIGKVTLPFFNKSVYRANVERAQQQQIAAEREIEALHRKLRGEAVAAHTEADNAARQADTFSKEVIPRTEKAAESTQNAWISSKASLLEVLESRRAMLNSRLEQRRFVAAHRAALEMLRSIVPPQTKP